MCQAILIMADNDCHDVGYSINPCWPIDLKSEAKATRLSGSFNVTLFSMGLAIRVSTQSLSLKPLMIDLLLNCLSVLVSQLKEKKFNTVCWVLTGCLMSVPLHVSENDIT